MPKITRYIPETEESITRPVVFDILRQLMTYTGISLDTQVLFPGANEAVAQNGSKLTAEARVRFNENSHLKILVDEESDKDYMLTTARFVGEQLRIFHDPVLDIAIKPIYTKTKVKIDFTYRGRDPIELDRWKRDIETRVEADRGVKLYTASYHYIIPEAFLAILLELHHLRENQFGYGETWNDWFTQHLTPRASVATNLAGRQGTWVVADTQQEIQGYFDFEGGPEKAERAGDAETHEIRFTYTFEYEKAAACAMRYPLQIHQQVVSKDYRPDKPNYNPEDTARVYGNSRRHLSHFERKSLLRRRCFQPGISIPPWDEFLPASIPPSTKRVFTAMMAHPATGDRQTLFNLKELGHQQLLPEIIAFLELEYQYVHILGESPFVLSLYAGIDHQSLGAVKLLPDLTVVTSKPIDMRIPYHVRLGLKTSLKTLTPRCRRVMSNNGKATLAILRSIDCTLERRGLLPSIVPDSDFIPDHEFEEVIDEIDRGIRDEGQLGHDQDVQWNTVQLFSIKAMRGESP